MAVVTKPTIAKKLKASTKKEAKDDEAMKEVEEVPVALVTHVENILDAIFSNVVVYINNQQIYNSNGHYGHKFDVSNNFKGAIFEHNGVLHRQRYDCKDFPEDFPEIMEATFSEPFF